MSGVEPICSHCAELDQIKKEIKEIKQYISHDMHLKELIPDRKRISRLEEQINHQKDALRQISVTKGEGTWGIVDKRADVVFSRLISVPVNGNGRKPFLSTADVKNILGVRSYAQGKEAMVRCTERHIDTQIIQRGQRKIGITLLEKVGP